MPAVPKTDRRRCVAKQDLVKYGYTDECQACAQLASGMHNVKVPHDDRCRDRIGELMAEDDDQRQVERASSRTVPEVEIPRPRPCARGAFERTRAMLASPGQRRTGVDKLRSEVYAATSRRTRRSRIKTLRKLAAEAGVDLVPVTNAGMGLLAAALKAGACRSAAANLRIWKQMHAKAGHP